MIYVASDSPMYDAIDRIFEASKRARTTRALIFPDGGPLESHVGMPDRIIDCEGGHYELSYMGATVCGYKWVPDAPA